MQAQAANRGVPLENIVPFYQPIFALANKRVDRYECLARLLDSNQQIVLPNEFLYIIESNHDTADMTSRILELSRAYCCPRQMSWSINLFAEDLDDKPLLANIEALCKDSSKGLCGIDLHFDCIKDNLLVLSTLSKRIPNLHITVDEIDEWGDSLYSVIASGVDAIKIKSSLIKQHAKTKNGRELITKFKLYCQTHNCKLIAEHIEDAESLAAVKEMEILYGQGFYLSHPVPKVVAVHSN
ncbi:EAL domain-containing protein [Glaciecola sp. SC05]|uniref:EAL domain-containing protein n=1 Tax=Glaciecola sp. SC05 TaxID=1987355 RepID=UPI003527834A